MAAIAGVTLSAAHTGRKNANNFDCISGRVPALCVPLKRKSDFLQFKPYRAIVAAPIKEPGKGGGFLKWIGAGLVLFAGIVAVVVWKAFPWLSRQ